MRDNSEFPRGRDGSKLIRALLVSAACVGQFGLFVAPAIAQGPASPPAGQSATSDQSSDVGEIVVTGRKRETTLAQTPASVTALDTTALQNANISRFDDLKKLAPSLNVERSTGGSINLNIRGVGTTAAGTSFEASVALYLNGIYSGGQQRETSWPIYDVERVEVYSGTQGGLSGQNTSVGNIQITTVRPGSTVGGYFRGGYELLRDGYNVEGAIDLPASESLRFRLAGFVQRDGGYLKNVSTGNDLGVSQLESVRGTVVWEPTSDLEVTGFLTYEHIYFTQPTRTVFDPVGAYTAFAASRFDWEPNDRLTAIFDPRGDDGGDPYGRSHQTRGAINIDWDLGSDYSLVSTTTGSWLTDFYLNDNDFTDAPNATRAGSTLLGTQDYSQFTQELRLASPVSAPFNYVIGAWYRHADVERQRTFYSIPDATTELSAIQNAEQTTSNKSIYGDAQYKLSPTLTIGGSLRGTWEKKVANLVSTQSNLPPYTTFPLTRKELTASFLDYAARLQYNGDNGLNLYASYVQSTKTGAIYDNVLNGVIITLKPERAKTSEVGIKYSRAGNFASLSLFDMKIENFQDVATAVIGGQLQFLASNRSVRHRGAEGQFTLLPFDGLQLNGSFLWLPYAKDKSLGGRNTRSPRWSYSLGARYTAELGNDFEAAVFGNFNHKDSYFPFPIGNPGRVAGFKTRAYNLLDVGAELKQDNLALRLVCSNCTNQYVWAGVVRSVQGGQPFYTAVIPPLRTLKLEAEFHF